MNKTALLVVRVVIGIAASIAVGYILSAPPPRPALPPTSTNPITKPAPTQREEVIGTLHNYRLPGGYHYHWDECVQAGTQLSISWDATGTVSVYILSETQYDYFKVFGLTARYVAYKESRSRTLTREIANTDTYYLIIKNSSLLGTLKIYSAEVKVTWWS